jgi:transcriptional regulator with XRE-family HTH domain
MQIFGRNIREARKQKKLTRAQLARASGVSISRISTLELGRGDDLDFELALMLAIGLGITMSALFCGVGFLTKEAAEKLDGIRRDYESRRRRQGGSLIRAISQAVPS